MRLPSKSETIAYFNSLNAQVEQVDVANSSLREWRVRWLDGAEECFPSLLNLWMDWIEHAHRILTDEAALQAFKTSYMRGDASQREQLQKWIDTYYSYPMGDKFDHPDFSHLWMSPCDQLPRDWKKRLQPLITRPSRQLAFPHSAKEFLNEQRGT